MRMKKTQWSYKELCSWRNSKNMPGLIIKGAQPVLTDRGTGAENIDGKGEDLI